MIDTNRIISTQFIRAVVPSAFQLALFMPFLFSCSNNQEAANDLAEFQVVHPTTMDTAVIKEYVADIQSIKNVELRSRVSGFIEKIYVDEGQNVTGGQLLFTISSQEFRDDLQKANALLKSAEAEGKVAEVELTRTKKLLDKNIVSQSELELSEAKFEAIQAKIDEAKSAVSTAQLNLSFTSIKAPFGGVINRIPNKTGSLVEEGTLLTSLSDNSEVYAYFNVSEKEYLDYATQTDAKSKDEVTLILNNGNLHPFEGKIETIEGEINRSTGNIAFRAKFPNPENLLKHGASGKVQVKAELKNVLLIPQKSTFEVQENIYVFVITEGNRVQQRKIDPSFRLTQLYVISSGLSTDDKIIYEGIQKLKDGDEIAPKSISFSQVINLKN